MNEHEEDRIKRMLRDALPPAQDSEPSRDLWPAVMRRLDTKPRAALSAVPLLDWALAGSLIAFTALAPAAIPVLLYYL